MSPTSEIVILDYGYSKKRTRNMLLGGLNKQAPFSFLVKRLPSLGGQFEQVSYDEFAGHRGAVSFQRISVFRRIFFFSCRSCSLPSEIKRLRLSGLDLPVLGFSFFFTEENQTTNCYRKGSS